jgi:hypothetical protein
VIRAATPLLRLLSSVASVESVQRIVISFETMRADVWMITAEEVLEDNERIFLLEREYRQVAGAFPLDLHVVPSSEVNERMLPAGETIFAR